MYSMQPFLNIFNIFVICILQKNKKVLLTELTSWSGLSSELRKVLALKSHSISLLMVSAELVLSFQFEMFWRTHAQLIPDDHCLKIIFLLYCTNKPHESSVPASKYTAQSQTACVCMQKTGITQSVSSQLKHYPALFWKVLFVSTPNGQTTCFSPWKHCVCATEVTSSDVSKWFFLTLSSHSFKCFII